MNEKPELQEIAAVELRHEIEEPSKTKPKTTDEETKSMGRALIIWRRFRRSKTGMFGLFGLLVIILIAIIGPYLTHYSITDIDTRAFLKAPNAKHWFGTTQSGKDIMALTLEGLRKSMIIGFAVAFIQTTIAALVGSSAAYFGGWIEKIILWVVDLMLVIPAFLIIAVLSQRLGSQRGSIPIFILMLGAFGWMLTARVIRSLTLSVKNLDYVRAARYMSVPSWTIIFKHIIPNVSSYLIIDFTLGMALAVLSETTLSYFGFGVQSPNTSLGTLIAEGAPMATTFPWVFLFPAIFLVSMLTMVNFMGDALRDAIDPSSKIGGKE